MNLYPLRRHGVDRPPPGTADSEASLVAFDLLGLAGEDLRHHPLEERRDKLARLIAGVEGLVFSEV
jgi:ATP-dependent DNA ligase